jgi:hypothetical protein
MNVQQLLLPLIGQLGNLAQMVNESPYISREGRIAITKEISALSNQLKEEQLSYAEGEKTLILLNKKAAADEIATLATKIRQLNPTSPRLEILRSLGNQLNSEEISPEQARAKIQELMRA